MSDFTCPSCDKEYSISDLELYEVYEEDGKETEFDCVCGEELIITSTVDSWSFDVEVNE